jgi:hypothetical protein
MVVRDTRGRLTVGRASHQATRHVRAPVPRVGMSGVRRHDRPCDHRADCTEPARCSWVKGGGACRPPGHLPAVSQLGRTPAHPHASNLPIDKRRSHRDPPQSGPTVKRPIGPPAGGDLPPPDHTDAEDAPGRVRRRVGIGSACRGRRCGGWWSAGRRGARRCGRPAGRGSRAGRGRGCRSSPAWIRPWGGEGRGRDHRGGAAGGIRGRRDGGGHVGCAAQLARVAVVCGW